MEEASACVGDPAEDLEWGSVSEQSSGSTSLLGKGENLPEPALGGGLGQVIKAALARTLWRRLLPCSLLTVWSERRLGISWLILLSGSPVSAWWCSIWAEEALQGKGCLNVSG